MGGVYSAAASWLLYKTINGTVSLADWPERRMDRGSHSGAGKKALVEGATPSFHCEGMKVTTLMTGIDRIQLKSKLNLINMC